MTSMILICPVCKQGLDKQDKQYRCGNNHTYDEAKEGYVNLYHNHGTNAGDDQEMLKARNSFLEKGYYEGISNVLNEIVIHYIQSFKKKDLSIMDAGCGEGYYLNRLKHKIDLCFPNHNMNYYGFDISKPAIKLAAKRNKGIEWFVANGNEIPIKNDSIDIFINMFSFYNEEEIKRILKKEGITIIIRAGQEHLIELKKIIYNELMFKDKEIDFDLAFFQVNKESYKFKINVTNQEDLQNLLMMTPHYWKAKPENKSIIKQLKSLMLTINLEVYVIKSIIK